MELSAAIERPRVDNVFLRKGPRPSQLGSLAIIGHHLIFSPKVRTPGSTQEALSNEEFWLLHRAVDRVSAEPLTKDNPSKGGLLVLKCKNFMICIFEMENFDDCAAVARTIETLSNLVEIEHEYPFYYRCPFTVLDDGWAAFDVEQEFARLSLHSSSFRISSANEGFKVCRSYPEKIIVPKGIGDDYLRISATFRDGGRFPVLSYYHQETKSPIFRCGQPLLGPTNRRCREDETILNSLLASSRGIIIDTRPKSIASNARSKGGGHETQMCYSQWKYANVGTPRNRELYDSLAKIVDACNERNASTDRWLSKMFGSGWLQAVVDFITAAATVAKGIYSEGISEVPVVVHGGEGTDSTLLVTSLAQVLLDSDARTIRGFESVIEREWVAAGHPFHTRNAHAAYAASAGNSPQEAPVFLCFLNCVWQVMQQYPCSFEFTEEFLIFLFEHAYASEFGTFLGDTEKEKLQYSVKKRTVSLWSYVNNPEILRDFVNTLYEPNVGTLWPSVAPQSIKLWERVFLRWQRDWTEADAVKRASAEWKSREKQLMSKCIVMRRQLIELMKEAQLQGQVQGLQITD